jgi:hypothetical protein
MAPEYNIAEIRELLLAAFTAEELRRFCVDRPPFRLVVNNVSSRAGLQDIVDAVITHCDKRLLFDQLLTEVQRINPAQYARHGPYRLAAGEQRPLSASAIQREILQAIPKLQDLSNRVADERIASSLGLEVQEVRDHLALMQEAGLVALTRDVGGTSATLTARGRVARKDPAYLRPPARGGDTYVLSGDFQGALVNINTVLDHASQSIGAIPDADAAAKEELQRLVAELKAALQGAPPAQAEEAEAVAEFAQELVETATEEAPNRVRLRISAEGLKAAADNLAAVVPPVLAIATQIANTILRLAGAS